MSEVLKTIFSTFLIVVINICVFIFLVSFLLGKISSSINYEVVYFILGTSIYQLIYVIPIIIWLKRQREWGQIKGIIIGAVITALVSGTCYVVVLPQFIYR